HGLSISLLKVQHDVALAAVEAQVGAALFAALGAKVTALVAVWGLDLDHVSAEIAKQGGAIGARQHGGEVEYAQAGQRACGKIGFAHFGNPRLAGVGDRPRHGKPGRRRYQVRRTSSCSSFHRRWGDAGVSSSSLPSGARASLMAHRRVAGVVWIAPSPHPFAPSGATGEGVTI